MTTSGSTRRRSPIRRLARSATRPADIVRNPGDQQWDLAIFKNFALGGTQKLQFRAEMFNFINHPNLSGPISDITNEPTSAARSTKDGNRRDIQLALRYMF